MTVNQKIFTDLLATNPSAIIELFTLQLSTALHGNNTTYRFHSGSNLNSNGEIVWQGNSYTRLPIEVTGFAFRKGQLPRPKAIISNKNGFISAILLDVNNTTTGSDLTAAVLTRITTQAKFLDAANFVGSSNSDADPNAEYPRETYSIDRKAAENREVVEFELAAPTDLAGVRIPKRQCTRTLFPSIGTFA